MIVTTSCSVSNIIESLKTSQVWLDGISQNAWDAGRPIYIYIYHNLPIRKLYNYIIIY